MPAHLPGPARVAEQIVVRRQLHGATILTLHRPATAPTSTRRVPFGTAIVDALDAEGLLGHVLWSTDCSVGDVEVLAFRRLSDAGLFLVRLDLGVPSGTAQRRQACTAVQGLRQLGILVEYEFDLAGPVQRFDALHENLGYLAAIVCDGSVPLSFRWPEPDPPSCSPWLAAYRERLATAIGPWLGESGLSERLGEAWADLVVAERMLRGLSGIAAHRIALQRLTMRANSELVSLVSRSAHDFEQSGESGLLDAAAISARCAGAGRSLDQLRTAFLDANADALIRSGNRYDPHHDRRPATPDTLAS
jgi:hypothetical protein